MGWDSPICLWKDVFALLRRIKDQSFWEGPPVQDPVCQFFAMVCFHGGKPGPFRLHCNDGAVSALGEAAGFDDADPVLLASLKNLLPEFGADLCTALARATLTLSADKDEFFIRP